MSNIVDKTIEGVFAVFILAIFGLKVFPTLFAELDASIVLQLSTYLALFLMGLAIVIAVFQEVAGR